MSTDQGQRRTLCSLNHEEVAIAPSILAADFARLGQQVRDVDAAGADAIHVDVMDGHFVPNLSLGPAIVQALRPYSSLPFDVHLMLSQPQNYVVPFAQAGADHITVHVEIDAEVETVLQLIRAQGCSAGLSVKPDTPIAALSPYLARIDLVLVMSVEPGFGGQSFREDVLPKVAQVRRTARGKNLPLHVEIDGGINTRTAADAVRAGANLLVAGTSVFRAAEGMHAAIQSLKTSPPADDAPRPR